MVVTKILNKTSHLNKEYVLFLKSRSHSHPAPLYYYSFHMDIELNINRD